MVKYLYFFVLLLAFSLRANSLNIGYNEAEQEGEEVASETQEQVINFVDLPDNLKDDLPHLLPYLPQPGDEFFFTQDSKGYHLYQHGKTQSVKIGSISLPGTTLGGTTAKGSNGLYYSSYIEKNPSNSMLPQGKYSPHYPEKDSKALVTYSYPQSNPNDVIITGDAPTQSSNPNYQEPSKALVPYSSDSGDMGTSKKPETTPAPTYQDAILGRSVSKDHATKLLQDGILTESIVAFPTRDNIGKEFSIYNAPPELFKEYREEILEHSKNFASGSKFVDEALNSNVTFQYVAKDGMISESNPLNVKVTFAGGQTTTLPLDASYGSFINQGAAYIPGKGYFYDMNAASPKIAYQNATAPELEKFIKENPEFHKIRESGTMPASWKDKKFTFEYITPTGKLVSEKLNPKQISDLVFGQNEKATGRMFLDSKGMKLLQSFNTVGQSLLDTNIDNPSIPVDPNKFNKEYRFTYYDGSGELQRKTMTLAEAYAFVIDNKPLMNRPKAKTREQYFQAMAEHIRSNKLAVTFEIDNPDFKTKTFFFGKGDSQVNIDLKKSEFPIFRDYLYNPKAVAVFKGQDVIVTGDAPTSSRNPNYKEPSKDLVPFYNPKLTSKAVKKSKRVKEERVITPLTQLIDTQVAKRIAARAKKLGLPVVQRIHLKSSQPSNRFRYRAHSLNKVTTSFRGTSTSYKYSAESVLNQANSEILG